MDSVDCTANWSLDAHSVRNVVGNKENVVGSVYLCLDGLNTSNSNEGIQYI